MTGWTKEQVIDQAFDALGLGRYKFDLPVELQQSALRFLDSMMAEWNGTGIRLGWLIPRTADGGEMSTELVLPDWAAAGVANNLAIRIANSIGREVPPGVVRGATSGLNVIMARSAVPGSMQYPQLPAGAGNRLDYSTPYLPIDDPLTTGLDGELEI